MKKLAVLGVGSAGIQSLSFFLKKLDNSWEITSIYDPTIPILGIGESTNPLFVKTMYWGTGLNLYTEIEKKELDSTLKLGTYYENWRKNSFINPLIGENGAALHLNTFKLKDWSFSKFQEKWNDKFKQIMGNVTSVKNTNEKVSIIIDSKEYFFDYVIDCRGFSKDSEDYVFVKNPTNHCLVHNKKEIINTLYTGHTATKDGWMFTVPLSTRTSYGYLFNKEITSIKKAKENFSKEIDVPIEELDNIEYSFNSYYAKKILDGRILKSGTRAVFFEPMFANSLAFYNTINEFFTRHIDGLWTEEKLNLKFCTEAESYRDMILFFYHGGSIYDTDFWKITKDFATEELKNSDYLNATINFVKEYKKTGKDIPFNWVFKWEAVLEIAKNMGYEYFN
jgi:tryptophan halogenase